MTSVLTVGIGDIQGRFRRVQEWLHTLEQARGRSVDFALAVGDLEAFASVDGLPLRHPLHFIAGNNEDFEALHPVQEGAWLPSGLRYLGRVGEERLEGLRVAFLSGIYAPRHYDRPLVPPLTAATRKEAGYFRQHEVERLRSLSHAPALMLAHEWPKGLVTRAGPRRYLAQRFPWIGNAPVRACVDVLQPQWLWCGHSHVPWAQTLKHANGGVTRVACLDQAAEPSGSVFWVEWERGAAVRAGWGTTGSVCWEADAPWGPDQVPESGLDGRSGERDGTSGRQA